MSWAKVKILDNYPGSPSNASPIKFIPIFFRLIIIESNIYAIDWVAFPLVFGIKQIGMLINSLFNGQRYNTKNYFIALSA